MRLKRIVQDTIALKICRSPDVCRVHARLRCRWMSVWWWCCCVGVGDQPKSSPEAGSQKSRPDRDFWPPHAERSCRSSLIFLPPSLHLRLDIVLHRGTRPSSASDSRDVQHSQSPSCTSDCYACLLLPAAFVRRNATTRDAGMKTQHVHLLAPAAPSSATT